MPYDAFQSEAVSETDCFTEKFVSTDNPQARLNTTYNLFAYDIAMWSEY